MIPVKGGLSTAAFTELCWSAVKLTVVLPV